MGCLLKKKKMSKGGDVKGVHKTADGGAAQYTNYFEKKGMSDAGIQAREGAKYQRNTGAKQSANTEGAKQEHERVLGEMKSMPNPKLPMAEGGKVMAGAMSGLAPKGNDVKGVHDPLPYENTEGVSSAGAAVRTGNKWGAPPMKGLMNHKAKIEHKEKLKELKEMPGPTSGKSGFAQGGFIGSHQSECHADCNSPCEVHEQASGYAEETHPNRMPNHQGLTDMGEQSDAHEEDMLHQVLAKRKMMSKGGEVANSDKPEADFMPNEFDYLHLNDGLEDNSSAGNEHGDSTLFEDAVSKVMMKRRKQHNPNPA